MEELSAITGLSVEEMRQHPELLINAFDKELRILFWNRRCEQLFGVEEAAALGHRLEDVLPYTKGHEKMALLHRALSGREVHILNGYYDKRSGKYEQRVIPVKDVTGRVIAALNIVRSIPFQAIHESPVA